MYFFYYIPVGIDAETRRFPVMTVACSLLCAMVFFIHKYLPDATPFDFNNFIYYPGISGWPTAVAAAFLHFDYFHLGGNLLYLLLFGWYLEDKMGTPLYSVLFVGAALVGNLAQAWFNANVLGVEMGIIGASGAVSAVMGAFLVRFYISRVKIAYWVFMPLQGYTKGGRVEVPIVFALALWVMMQLARGAVQLEGASVGVAHMTHIAGFLFGIALTLATGGWKQARAEAHLTRARRYLRKGEVYGAQDELSRYVAVRTDDGQAHAELARVRVQAGDDVGAKASYLVACEILLRSQERGQCEDVFEQAVRGYPDFVLSTDPHLDLAFGLERNLKPNLALVAYENFARRYPRHKESPFTILRAANIYSNVLGDAKAAKRCYGTIIEMYPEDAWVDYAREQVRVLA